MKRGHKGANTRRREPDGAPGPLESLRLKGHCEMCGAQAESKRGANGIWKHGAIGGLEAAFNPSSVPMTLCQPCRSGSAELLAAQRGELIAACKVAGRVWEQGDLADAVRECVRVARRAEGN